MFRRTCCSAARVRVGWILSLPAKTDVNEVKKEIRGGNRIESGRRYIRERGGGESEKSDRVRRARTRQRRRRSGPDKRERSSEGGRPNRAPCFGDGRVAQRELTPPRRITPGGGSALPDAWYGCTTAGVARPVGDGRDWDPCGHTHTHAGTGRGRKKGGGRGEVRRSSERMPHSRMSVRGKAAANFRDCA